MAQLLLQESLDAIARGDDWGVDVVRLILDEAVARGYSDVRVLPRRSETLISARAQGGLVPLGRIPAELTALLAARLKVLARLPTFVRHKPQDGRIDWQQGPDSKPILLRISFLPALHGESVLVRLPEAAASRMQMEQLGMPEDMLAALRAHLLSREGVILLTGPAGSGKTTTLYAMMEDLHRRHGDRMHFLTIEDPVERDLDFATQVQINELQELSFAAALRSAVRQDPNVLLIGEIRDLETARTTMQAALSGHLVLSTLHAGRAATVPGRLLSIGVDPWLLASALSAAIAQRLVRFLCPQCRVPQQDAVPGRFQEGPGCTACGHTGYSGRAGVFEYLPVTETIRELILSRTSSDNILSAAAETRVGDLAAAATVHLNAGRISRREFEYAIFSEELAANHGRKPTGQS